jgi:C4-dicarboxylate-specific signal transduction histidine kinase
MENESMMFNLGLDMNDPKKFAHPKVVQSTVQQWQETVDLLTEEMQVPVALIMHLENDRLSVQVKNESQDNPYEIGSTEKCSDSGLYCETVIRTKERLFVPNALEDEMWKTNPDVKLNMINYLGYPLTWPNGDVYGTICVRDTQEHHYSDIQNRIMLHLKKSIDASLEVLEQSAQLLISACIAARNEERLRLAEQIAQMDRRRSLGEIAASLGHEIKQPLAVILTYAQVAKRGIKTGQLDNIQLVDLFEKIINNSQRAGQIIERVRNVIRPGASRREPVELEFSVREVIELVAAEAKSNNVTFSFAPVEFPVWVTGVPIQLSQIILNVIRNSIESLAGVDHRKIHFMLYHEKDRAILKICDSGPGLSPDVVAQAGTPFFTTKPEGLGMGLLISGSIAKQHDGTLRIYNSVDRGAIVELNLPALSNPDVAQVTQ